MNTIPMSTIVKALCALKAARAQLMDKSAPDSYMEVFRAIVDLEFDINQMAEVEVEA